MITPADQKNAIKKVQKEIAEEAAQILRLLAEASTLARKQDETKNK